ncbi:MAG: hypothetical protein D3923_18215 [Candidatus Electrothrix sp. AR3]|nr:hypothetical protein [Candidatus Electrothrix sp. AR3]
MLLSNRIASTYSILTRSINQYFPKENLTAPIDTLLSWSTDSWQKTEGNKADTELSLHRF